MGRVRLRGGIWNKGRVEIYHWSYSWGAICDDDSDDNNNSHVICKQLGFSGRATAVHGSAHYGEGIKNIDDVACNGNEQYLWDCTSGGGTKITAVILGMQVWIITNEIHTEHFKWIYHACTWLTTIGFNYELSLICFTKIIQKLFDRHLFQMLHTQYPF